jgi:ribonuclease P protein component
VKRRFRLTRSNDFKRVRRSGKSYAHPFAVLYVLACESPGVRVGVAAGRAVGNAIQRNRAKRLLRAAMQPLCPQIAPGFDLVLIARQPLPSATFAQTGEALVTLLTRAGLFIPPP